MQIIVAFDVIATASYAHNEDEKHLAFFEQVQSVIGIIEFDENKLVKVLEEKATAYNLKLNPGVTFTISQRTSAYTAIELINKMR